MRKKILTAALSAALLAGIVGAALAAPGTSSDPLVTLSYLTGTYAQQLEQQIEKRAQSAVDQAGQEAFDRLDALAGSYLAQAGGGAGADSYVYMVLARGDALELSTGAALLLQEGQTDLFFASGCLVDVTTGSTVRSGDSLTAGHHYVAAEATSCTVNAVSDSVYLAVRGEYLLTPVGKAYTPFVDITGGDWYADAVLFAYEQQLFQGLTATVFSPDTEMNRAMLATVLSRLAGAQGAAPSAGFTDVTVSDWYANAVNWAAGAGIVNGLGDGSFGPNNSVTREQMATMLYRYARDYLGMKVTAAGDLSVFSDRDQISAYAVDAVAWAVGCGIMNGHSNGTLSPGGTATRAQVASMLQRFSALI